MSIKQFFENLNGATITFNTFWSLVLLLSILLVLMGTAYPFLLVFGYVGFKVFLLYSLYQIVRIGLGYEKNQKTNNEI